MKKTLVLGLGISGIAAAEFLLRKRVFVLGIDSDRSVLGSSPEIRRLQSLGLFVQHDSCPIEWNQVDCLVVSPGISPSHPVYRGARESGVIIMGEAELALPHFQKPLVAVTGTNGKTTVALLVEHILKASAIKAKALGNLGIPLCSYLLGPEEDEAFIVELSSYQLETMHMPVFSAAVVLNITPDHLDRYSSMEEYAQAKCQLQHLMKGSAHFFVQRSAASEFDHLLILKNYQTFGCEKTCDLWIEQSVLAYREKIECLLPLSYRGVGRHDCENALAAWALCQPFSISNEQFCNALGTFQKPPHRIEFVREVGGVSFYDDSKGTNIDAVVQAVRAMRGPVILIAGGVDKGASYLLWKDHFSGKVKKIIAIGQAAPKIYSELHPYFNVQLADTLSSAVQDAAADAESGDSVLLSPGCSSYDMFRNYAHRGEEFKRYVEMLSHLKLRRRS
jgi:UDP-N-acetylmuramoylalanine--D-glutamate ligase